MKVHITKLGCARNQVDSEIMAGALLSAGCELVPTPDLAEVLVVNTCSFITDAAQESVDVILELAELKTEGICQRLVVTSCLPQRYGAEIAGALPEVDCFLGTGAFDQIVKAVKGEFPKGSVILLSPELAPIEDVPAQSRDNALVAYIKIAEGCSRTCTYCIIPVLRGRQRSRKLAGIVADAQAAIAGGAKELVLVAQDSTAYGEDLGPDAPDLGALVCALGDLTRNMPPADKPWIRVMYGHPDSIKDSFIAAVKQYDNVCPYFDLPVQHISPAVLRKMGRGYNAKKLYDLFAKIKNEIPGSALRTTLITGFPGETEDDFIELEHFVETVRFEHLGVFTYSDGDDLPSHNLKNHVPEDVARERMEAVMQLQCEISAAYTQSFLGRTVTVLVEEADEDGIYLCRTMWQAPEVDGLVYVHAPEAADLIGRFVAVEITDTLEYDLVGRYCHDIS